MQVGEKVKVTSDEHVGPWGRRDLRQDVAANPVTPRVGDCTGATIQLIDQHPIGVGFFGGFGFQLGWRKPALRREAA